jgi:hypothetical protein
MVCPFGIVSEIGGCEMLDSVDSPLPENRLAVGFFHADIKGGNHLAAHIVFA